MKPLEEEIQMIKTAHSRLLNQYKDLEKQLNLLKSKHTDLEQVVLEQLLSSIKNDEPVYKPSLIAGNRYVEEISEIISIEKKEWNGGQFINYELKFKDRQEIYTAFISIKYVLEPKMKIKFFYAGEGKLSNVKSKFNV